MRKFYEFIKENVKMDKLYSRVRGIRKMYDDDEYEDELNGFILDWKKEKPEIAVNILTNLLYDGHISAGHFENSFDEIEDTYDYQKYVIDNDRKDLDGIIKNLHPKIKKEYPWLVGGKRSGIV